MAELTGRHASVCDTDLSKALVKTTRAKIDVRRRRSALDVPSLPVLLAALQRATPARTHGKRRHSPVSAPAVKKPNLSA